MELGIFSDIIYILLLATFSLFICNIIHLPAIVGLLLVGIIGGPHGLSIIKSIEGVEYLAEIGVILLLFTIGIECSIQNIVKIKKILLKSGSFQVLVTFGFSFAASYFSGIPVNKSIFIGLLITMSSTAIIMREIQKRGDIDTPHGRITFGTLILQDILVVPMMLSIPLLAGESRFEAASLFPFLLKSFLVITGIIITSKWLLPNILHQIARTRDQDLFIITIILIGFGIGFLTHSIGLSLALGAFIAGLILSESPYGHRALGNILPLRDIFMSFFFVSIGMLLDVRIIITEPLIIIGGTVLVIALKFVFATGAAIFGGIPLRSALISGFYLAQIGEFSFVLASAGLAGNLLSTDHFQIFLGVSILSMILTPLMINLAPTVANQLIKLPLPARFKAGKFNNIPESSLIDHIVIIGFGLCGKTLAEAARKTHIPFVIIEANPDTVNYLQDDSTPIYHGDASYEPVLEHAGITEARVAVIAISDPAGTNRIVDKIRSLNPTIYIIARTRYVSQAHTLFELGANEVIPEEYETSIEMFIRVLNKYLIQREEIENIVSLIRSEGYEMLRSMSTEKTPIQELDVFLSGMDVRVIQVEESSGASGRTLAQLGLRKDYGITVLATIRNGEKTVLPGGDTVLQPGDSIVTVGLPELLVFANSIFKKH